MLPCTAIHGHSKRQAILLCRLLGVFATASATLCIGNNGLKLVLHAQQPTPEVPVIDEPGHDLMVVPGVPCQILRFWVREGPSIDDHICTRMPPLHRCSQLSLVYPDAGAATRMAMA
eukprot:CAMPEP_0115191266 /NCGR_PEP_ID=MMETSP0270-20121206/12443_1 /TAXON_ID=71861 /ORGANISM="Scrippsiella trochoidea, Strain CCMP3099" /LENGTH=116 /DNA_ID=CAMNT_0002604485 /DNA_START=192 /DNA_END=542 /DNA_ORIENTATION=+